MTDPIAAALASFDFERAAKVMDAAGWRYGSGFLAARVTPDRLREHAVRCLMGCATSGKTVSTGGVQAVRGEGGELVLVPHPVLQELLDRSRTR